MKSVITMLIESIRSRSCWFGSLFGTAAGLSILSKKEGFRIIFGEASSSGAFAMSWKLRFGVLGVVYSSYDCRLVFLFYLNSGLDS